MVTGCVFQDQRRGERCPLANSVYPAVLCGRVLLYACSQDKVIHFPVGFSGVLIAVIAERFTNSNLILQPPSGRKDGNLVQRGLKGVF